MLRITCAKCPLEPGLTVEVLYDPEQPDRNSLADALSNPWMKWAARLVGMAFVLLVIWLWGDQEWLKM